MTVLQRLEQIDDTIQDNTEKLAKKTKKYFQDTITEYEAALKGQSSRLASFPSPFFTAVQYGLKGKYVVLILCHVMNLNDLHFLLTLRRNVRIIVF